MCEREVGFSFIVFPCEIAILVLLRKKSGACVTLVVPGVRLTPRSFLCLGDRLVKIGSEVLLEILV